MANKPQKIFITGISSGIGRALAVQLVRTGHEVWGTARRKELLEQLSDQLDGKLLFSGGDTSNIDDNKKIAAEMRAKNFIPDAVILNAGIHARDIKDGLIFSEAQTALKTNLEGPLFWISEFLPDFLKRRDGLFVGISSTSAYRPYRGTLTYSATKSALSMLFRGLRLNFAKTGVRFSAIHFGPIATEMWRGKKGFSVSSPEAAAQFIVSTLDKKSASYFFPVLSTSLMRLSVLLPDKIFSFFTSLIKNKNGK